MNKKPKPAKPEPDLPLPTPIELATLAALLLPDAEPDAALSKAMEFYVEAVALAGELRPLSLQDLVKRFGSTKRSMERLLAPYVQATQAQWNDTLQLEPDKDDDDARRFLFAGGLVLKQTRSVLKNIRRMVERIPPFPGVEPMSAEYVIAKCKDGKTTYRIPKFILESVLADAKARRRETKLKVWKNKRQKQPVK